MSASQRNGSAADSMKLHAYHDGELSGLARWRFERRLRGSPELRRELEALAQVRRVVRGHDLRTPAPDLWGAIALRLPAIDASRGEAQAQPRSAWGFPRFAPVGAAVAVAAAVALAIGLYSGETAPIGAEWTGVVQWMDSGDRAVMVLEGDEDVTIIWVFDDPSEGASMGGFGGAA